MRNLSTGRQRRFWPSARPAALAAAFAFVTLLAACGGGGGSGGSDAGAAPALPATPGGAPVVVPAVVPASITVQPADQSVVAGSAASFSVSASGDGLAYQWQRSVDAGGSWSAVAGATGASFVVPAVGASLDGSRWRVVVSGTANSVTSSAVTLTVSAAVLAPAISVDAAAQTVSAGADAVFTVTASGSSLAYQWQLSTDGSTFTDVAGATAPTLTLTAVALVDSGRRYRVVVRNAAATVTGTAALLTVLPAPASPVIVTQPLAASVTAGGQATFSVAVTGTPAPTFAWQTSRDGGLSWAAAGSGASITTAALTLADNGVLFRVVVGNSAGAVTSLPALLTVTAAAVAPAIVTQPLAATITAPAGASFTVVASGTPTPTYQWQLSSDGGASFANINGATQAAYSLATTSTADSGKRLRVRVVNSAGSVTSSAVLLTVNAGATVFPAITASPVAAFVTAPAPATFSVTATGSPAPTYQWQVSTDGGASFGNVGGATAATYTTPATTVADSGSSFRVRVSNSLGSSTSGAVPLTVYAAVDPSALPPPIAGDPAFSSSCSGTPAVAAIGPFATQPGDCFVSYTLSAADLAAYQANYGGAAVRSTILEAVRANFKDGIDAVFVVLDSDASQRGSLPFGVNYPVQNCSVHDPACPRFSRLGNVWLTARTDLQSGPSLHELLHGFHTRMTADGGAGFIVPTTVDAHWGFSSGGGQLGGWDKASLVALGGGSWRARGPLPPANYAQPGSFGTNANGGNAIPYSNLELWTMGLIPDAELLAVDVAENPAFTAAGVFSASAIRSYSPAEIVARVRAAARPSTATPRAFRALVVLATTRSAPDASTIGAMNGDIEQFTMRAPATAWAGLYNVFTGSGRRMTLQMANASALAR